MLHKNAKSVAATILVSIEPVSTGSPATEIQVQGNWPGQAEWGFHFVRNDKGVVSEGVEYFMSEEDMKDRIFDLKNDPSAAYVLGVYRWDLGPEFIENKYILK